MDAEQKKPSTAEMAVLLNHPDDYIFELSTIKEVLEHLIQRSGWRIVFSFDCSDYLFKRFELPPMISYIEAIRQIAIAANWECEFDDANHIVFIYPSLSLFREVGDGRI